MGISWPPRTQIITIRDANSQYFPLAIDNWSYYAISSPQPLSITQSITSPLTIAPHTRTLNHSNGTGSIKVRECGFRNINIRITLKSKFHTYCV